MKSVVDHIQAHGFHFEPWQVAAYATALRTKPFVILAGVSGTGKSKLPTLVAQATGGVHHLVPVRPDWTDSAEVLGYCDLKGIFRPGQVLQRVKAACEDPDRHHVCIVDEMNLARVEHYFAEVLSRIEDRAPAQGGGYQSAALVTVELRPEDSAWGEWGLPPNFALVGTVNMDESTHGFSKKVLDRAFTLELSDVDLRRRMATQQPLSFEAWPAESWRPRAVRLGELTSLTGDDDALVDEVIETLTRANSVLGQAQMQVGYRTRDEVALFVLHAQEVRDSFVTETGAEVDPLDLALLMKILPRISGGSVPVRNTVLRLLAWALGGPDFAQEQDAEPTMQKWRSEGQPGAIESAVYPRTAARLCLMWDRLRSEGFTSFWL